MFTAFTHRSQGLSSVAYPVRITRPNRRGIAYRVAIYWFVITTAALVGIMDDWVHAQTGTFIDRHMAGDLRVVSYNILNDVIFPDIDPVQAAKFERVLAALDPDILILQEIRDKTAEDVRILLNKLAPLAPSGSWHVHKGGDNVIASKYPLSLTATNTIPPKDGTALALVDLPDDRYGADLYVMNNHFTCCNTMEPPEPLDPREQSRQREADALVNWMRDARNMGEFIDLPDGTARPQPCHGSRARVLGPRAVGRAGGGGSHAANYREAGGGHTQAARTISLGAQTMEDLAAPSRQQHRSRVLSRIAQENLELATRSHATLTAQREAGAASLLDENLARGQALTADLGVRRARLDAANAKRRLARLMSVADNVDDIVLSDSMPGRFEVSMQPEALIALARKHRLDLKALEQTARSRAAKVGLVKIGIIPEMTVGPSYEREIETILGPALTMTLPLFDQNQARIARADFLLQKALREYDDAFIRTAQDIRIALDETQTAHHSATFYRNEVVPQAERNLEFATASYSAGQTNILTLIEAQRLLLEARQGLVTATLEASTAVAHLEQSIGLPLDGLTEREPMP